MNIDQSALLLIEFQNEWLSEKGKLNRLFTDKEQFLSSVKNAESIINSARNGQVQVIHSGLHFTESNHELGNAKYGLRAHIAKHKTFLAGTFACQFSEPFKPQNNEFVVQGRIGSSAFSGSNLDVYLRNNNIKTLYIMGYALHVCIESTLRAAHDLGYEMVIIEDASAAFTKQQKEYFLTEIIHHFGSSIKSNDFLTLINCAGS